MTTILLMLKDRPSWKGVIVKSDYSIEKVKEALKKYSGKFDIENCFKFLLMNGIDDVTLSFIDDAMPLETIEDGEMDAFGYGICFICGRYELIKYKSKYGRLICVHCADNPSEEIMKKLEGKEKLKDRNMAKT